MRCSTTSRLMAIVTVASRSVTSFVPPSASNLACSSVISTQTSKLCGRPTTAMSSVQRFMSNTANDEADLKQIAWEEMHSIIDVYERLGREKSGILVLDVRNEDEISKTGQLSPNTMTLPLPAIMQYNLFEMPKDEFEVMCGFRKPTLDEKIVFSCAAGIRATRAAKLATAAGYSNVVIYTGGANEWFTR